jgi:hypothetical protein
MTPLPDRAHALEYHDLEERIAATIATDGPADERGFNDLALAVHRFQRRWNAPYDNYCRQLGARVDLADWRDIPAAPQAAFKRFDLRAFPAAETAHTFRTSGTTGEGWGSHHFRSLRLYEASIQSGWRHFHLPDGLPQIVLTPRPEQSPHSSLAHMMGVLKEFAPADEQHFCLREDGALDFERLSDLLTVWQRANQPVLLLGTALAFLHLFETLERRGERLPMAAGSQAMETGGYKGSGRSLTKPELYAQFENRLGLPPDSVINEYGMTELSTPFYTRGLNRPHCGPPWARALVIDPETGGEAEVGETGAVRLFDLANLGSVLAIQTQDLAVRREGRGFELLGRDPAALPRGCSRAADEMLQAAR